MRCFVAIPLPADVREGVAAVQRQAREACGSVDMRWIAPTSMHLTLKFLGNVPADRLDAIREVLTSCVAGSHLPRVSLSGVGAFPSPRRAQVVWLGVAEGAAAVGDLAAAIDGTLAPLGFEPEARPFAAHLTLGRVRAPRRGADLRGALAALCRVHAGSWTPHSVVLYESHLRPSGAVHEVRAEWWLG